MAGEFVGGAFLSASLQVLFDRLASSEVLNFFLARKHNQKLLDRLKTSLSAASVVLCVAEYERIRNQAVKDWLDDLQDAVYHADDLLDEISTNSLTQKEVTNVFSRFFNLYYSKMGNKIEEVTDKLESIVKHKDILGLEKKARENLSCRPQSSWRSQTTSLVDESNVYGRDEDKQCIVNILLDEKCDSKLSVISIVGMGGIGKTTLAQLVYNDDNVKQKFNLKAWVCVSEEFDILKITKSILKIVAFCDCNVEDLNSLQLELKERLLGKRFLIVLDDIRNEDYIEWEHLLCPFLHGTKGCKILLTTRSEKVASVVPTNPAYTFHVGQLSDENSWFLFTKHAFLSTDCTVNTNLEKIGRQIVKKCKGLPLAIKALGGLLRSKYHTKEWNLILKSDIWDIPENECKLFPALRISYHYLPPHLKQCFAYCSLFSKDYEFRKEELILLWMAEGFLQSSKKGMTLEEVGSINFDALVSRSFFQHSNIKEGCFVMHDLMHDLSLFVAGEFYLRLGDEDGIEIPKKTRHLSFDAFQRTLVDVETFCCVGSESLRTLLLLEDSFHKCIQRAARVREGSYPYMMRAAHVDRLLSKFKCLRVLSLHEFQDEALPDSIGQLIHLRYLDLTGSNIKKLPESLCNLYNLQTLKLGNSTILPKGMNKLKNLYYLPYFHVSKDDGATIRELGGLPNIGKQLWITYLENVQSGKEAFEARMMDKKYLEDLGLIWTRNADDTIDSQMERNILDNLQPHSNLKVLVINGYRGTIFPDWVGLPSYHNIVELTLQNCRNCCMLPSLGQLPSLRELKIWGFDQLVTIGVEFYKTDDSSLTTPFRSLEYLEFNDMPAWQEWCSIETEAFPSLLHLNIMECPLLVGCYMPASVKELTISNCRRLEFSKQQCYESLESLQIFDGCDSLTSFPAESFPNVKRLKFGRAHHSFQCFPVDGFLPPSLSYLSLWGLPSLETLDCYAFQNLISVQQLEIVSCHKLEPMAVERLAAAVPELYIYIDDCYILPEELQHLNNVEVFL